MATTLAGDSVAVERDLMIPMRDGVRLAVDVYRSARNGAAEEEPFALAARLREAPLLGEHTFAILRDVAGMNDDEIAEFAATGVFQ